MLILLLSFLSEIIDFAPGATISCLKSQFFGHVEVIFYTPNFVQGRRWFFSAGAFRNENFDVKLSSLVGLDGKFFNSREKYSFLPLSIASTSVF